jgi:hypothetical protein
MNTKIQLKDLRWCSKCLTMSFRPKVAFNSRGLCDISVCVENNASLNWRNKQYASFNLMIASGKSKSEND